MTTLDKLDIGERGVVTAIRARGKLRRRLQDMGVVKNVEIEVVNTAPLGDPIDIKVRGVNLALRRREAAQIEVGLTRKRLSGLQTGDTAVIVGFEAGRGLRRRLLAMGLVPGESIRIIRAESSDPIIIAVKDSRVMLGRGMARKIMVYMEDPADVVPAKKVEESVQG